MATMEGIHRLSDELGAKYDDSEVAIILYDIRSYSPIRKMTLITDEMQELYNMWRDGRCPVCLTEIPLHDVVCDNCHRDAWPTVKCKNCDDVLDADEGYHVCQDCGGYLCNKCAGVIVCWSCAEIDNRLTYLPESD
jgi:hypothetical protein